MVFMIVISVNYLIIKVHLFVWLRDGLAIIHSLYGLGMGWQLSIVVESRKL